MKIIQGLDYFPNYLSEEKIDILRQDINFALINAPLWDCPKFNLKQSNKFLVIISHKANIYIALWLIY